MPFFEMSPDEAMTGDLEAESPWGLPGIECDVCGETWGNVGTAYPTVDLAAWTDAALYENRWPVDRATFALRRERIVPLVPPRAPLPPGTDLGPLRGRASGRHGDVVWLHSWTPLLRASALASIRGALGDTRCVPTRITTGRSEFLYQIEVVAHGRLSASCFRDGGPPCCEGCGHEAFVRPSMLVLDAAALVGAPPIFRLSDLTTAIVVGDAVARAIVGGGLSGALLSELQVE
jgi:uncharacterized double-CXXCG motif protein